MNEITETTATEGGSVAVAMRERVERMQREVSKLPQYQPQTEHFFHAGMYCRQVLRHANVLNVGKVHKKEHFYVIACGTVAVTTDDGEELITGPRVLKCKAGTKRAVYSVTPAMTMTFHICNATTVEEAERELVEEDETSTYALGNLLKNEQIGVSP